MNVEEINKYLSMIEDQEPEMDFWDWAIMSNRVDEFVPAEYDYLFLELDEL